ncbi:MAG: hypothetical protein C0518_12440 [Opitutus sp.]|nr:hypothetical protein [Opitutus sp.]
MKCNRSVLLALLLPWLAARPLHADILGARPLPPPSAAAVADAPRHARATPTWPRPAPPPPLRVVPRDDDDAPGRWLQLRFASASLNLDVERLDDWLRLAEPTAHQLEWVNRWSPAVRLGVSHAPASVLPNLAEPTWSRHLASLRQEWGRNLELLVDDDSQRNTDMTRVLGGRTRVLVYDLHLPATGGSRHRLMQVAVELPGGVLVFACSGASDKVAAMSAVFQRFIVRAELAATAPH